MAEININHMNAQARACLKTVSSILSTFCGETCLQLKGQARVRT